MLELWDSLKEEIFAINLANIKSKQIAEVFSIAGVFSKGFSSDITDPFKVIVSVQKLLNSYFSSTFRQIK
jgi:hypothetical protein